VWCSTSTAAASCLSELPAIRHLFRTIRHLFRAIRHLFHADSKSSCVLLALPVAALGAISGIKTLDNGAVGKSARGYTIMDEDQLWGPGHELAFIHARRSPVPEPVIHDVESRLAALGLKPDSTVSTDGRSAVVSVEVEPPIPIERIQAAVGVFALFGTLSSLELKQAGVGLAAAVLIDATLIRGVLLPATMKLLSDWSWYLPRRLSWLPRIRHEQVIPPERLQATLNPIA
jgi:hypothetical protein